MTRRAPGTQLLPRSLSTCWATVVGEAIYGQCHLPGKYNIMVMGTRKDVDAMAFDDKAIEYAV